MPGLESLPLGATKCTPVGIAPLMVKLAAVDVPPPGAGLTTITIAVPGKAMAVAGMAAVSCVPLIYEVGNVVPFHCTAEEEMKLFPFTVSANAIPPAAFERGESELMDGTGSLIGKLATEDIPPPGEGLNTVTLAIPAAAMSAADIVAVSCVALT